MAAEKLTLGLSLVLLDIADERDACVARLTEILEAQHMESTHLVRENPTTGLPFRNIVLAAFGQSRTTRLTPSA